MKKQDPSINSLKHGCRTSYVRLLPGETQADYDEVANTWLKKYFPADDAQIELVRQLIDAAWQLHRSERNFENVQYKLFTQTPDQTEWSVDQQRKFNLAKRYKTADFNIFHKALKAVEHIQKNDHVREERREFWVRWRNKQAELDAQDRKLNAESREMLDARPTIPSIRHDGGCACAVCLYRLGLERFFAAQEEGNPPKNLAPDRP